MPEFAPPPTMPLSAGELSAFRSLRVLVVEDEYVLAQSLQHELEARGAEVMGPVPSVATAMALLSAGPPPDAAILDINLGGEMAFPVADVLRAQGVPFVFATGFDAWSIPQAYADVPHCEKPLDLARCLRALLNG